MLLLVSLFTADGVDTSDLSVAKVKKEMLRRPQMQNDFNLLSN
jgi:hypothetical protein